MKTKTLIILFLIGISLNASAYDFSAVAPTGQTLYYRIVDIHTNKVWVCPPNSNTNYLWYGYTTPSGALTIPNSVTYGGTTYTVKNIDINAFYGCANLTSVTIPDSIVSISYQAFHGCAALTTVNIGNSVGVIDSKAFRYCSQLTSINFGNSVSSFGDYAFDHCYHLTSVTIPNSVTTIGNSAFSYCTRLNTLTIGKSVVTIGLNSFDGCDSLTTVFFNADSCNGMSSNSSVFKDCPNFTNLIIGNNVKVIPAYAFARCNGLTSVTIPDSVIFIREESFYFCTGLTTVNILGSVASIGVSAFRYCDNLSTISIPSSVTTINDYAFYGCSGLIDITSMAVVAPSLGSNVFTYCPSSVVVNIPCGSLSSYNSVWNYFSNFSESFDYSLVAQSSDNTTGTVTTLNQPSCQSPWVAISATANNGYRFSHWSNGNTSNPDTVFLTCDSIVTGFFIPDQYSISLHSNDENMGTVSGGGTYNNHETITLTAHPTEHCHFVRWSDGNTDNPRQYIVTGDATLTAYFAIDTHSVSVVSNNIARGMVNSTGTEFVYGTPCTVTATAYTGFEFIRWSNGVTANPYTFAVLGDVELTAIFVAPGEETYTVTVSVNDPTMGTATVNGNASASVTSGTEVTLTATSNEGYRFVRWNDNNTNAVRTITVTSDMSFTATFEAMGSTEGIDEADGQTVVVYAAEGSIHIDAAQPAEASIYDMMGHRLATVTTGTSTPLPAGVYLVKVGTQPARKVVVIR